METKNEELNVDRLLMESKELQGALGATAWATLEMFKQAGMPESERESLYAKMTEYFAKPSDQVCNAVLSVLEKRLCEEKNDDGTWYS